MKAGGGVVWFHEIWGGSSQGYYIPLHLNNVPSSKRSGRKVEEILKRESAETIRNQDTCN